MASETAFSTEELRYLTLLAKRYPTVRAASRRIIQLRAILDLPKGCEHFISDVHGEYEAFLHVLNSCSGVVREKLHDQFGDSLPPAEAEELATLIYYPREKLADLRRRGMATEDWYAVTLRRLARMCRMTGARYTHAKVRRALPAEYADLLEELMEVPGEGADKKDYYDGIIAAIIATGQAPDFIRVMCAVIKRLAVDRLHLVGDIFDRGPRADIIMDSLLSHHSVDIQWGNHDILWMGAASGSRTLVATVLSNSIHYNNLEVVETGYGISLRPLSVFANEVYKDCDVSRFAVKLTGDDAAKYTEKDKLLSARMHKAITVILFKLEGQKIMRHPSWDMADRLLLDKIDYEDQSITIQGVKYHLEDCDFPTVDRADPYKLTSEEERVIDQLTASFLHSEKLQRHVRFLYSKGSLYKIYNGNLLFHGCIPLNGDGSFMTFTMGGKERKGREYLDYADAAARRAYYLPLGSRERQLGMDLLWFLWAGRNSPIFGRDRMTTFERRLIADESAWTEPKNPYYTLYNDPAVCQAILQEFGLGPGGHIINGHVPVKAKKGESPIKGGGKLIVIDGGFCKAYQPTSGIAGYTLTFNSYCLRIISHQPFAGKEKAVRENFDIDSTGKVVETLDRRMTVAETDEGRVLQGEIDDLDRLLAAYRAGAVPEDHRS